MQLITADRKQVTHHQRTMGPSGSLPWTNWVPPQNQELGGSAAGVHVNESTALQVGAVWGSVRVLTSSVATLPVQEFSGHGLPTDKLITGDSQETIINDPFSEIDLVDFMTQFVMGLSIRGNFYGEVVSRDPKTLSPTQIMPVHPDHAQVRRPDRGPKRGQLVYTFNGSEVANSDVIHVRNLSVAGAIEGLNPVAYLRNDLGYAYQADRWGGSFMANSAMPLGVIQSENDYDDEEVLAWADAWKQAHQGINRANLPAILTGGAKFNAISFKPEDMQFIQSKGYTAGVISGMIFGVPPHMVGIVDRTTSWGVGIEQQELGFYRGPAMPYVLKYERMISKCLPTGRYSQLNLGARLRGDTLQRFQAWALAMGSGWLNADEVRSEEKRPPIPDGKGKTYYIGVNMTPLGSQGVGGTTGGAGPGGLPLVPNPSAPDAAAEKAPSGQ